MKKYVVLVLVAFFGLSVFGCGKKQATTEESQEPMSMATLSTLGNETPSIKPEQQANQTTEAKTPSVQGATASEVKLEPLPPQGPYKPTGQEIQTALKNAGLYAGTIDGKVGPVTKKAIEEFQKSNNLKVDGKVGPQTWVLLSKYLSQETPQQPAPKQKKGAKKVN